MENTLLVNRLSGLYLGDSLAFRSELASGIDNKWAVSRLQVLTDTVVGDAQADARHHGGPDRVLHHFPREHYGQYRRWDLITDLRDAPSMGENISTVGLNESQIHIGDIVSIGEVRLQVTQPRSPCYKLNLQFGHREFALAMQQTAMCGWFYRVLEPGTIGKGDEIRLLERLSGISVAEAMRLYFLPEFDAKAYEKLAACPGLAPHWVNSLQKRLANQGIENWQMRLYGPTPA
ncbi:MOSC domain-containing protein [Shewanella sp. AS16]|uniref:MOSC domain-containing protein n=1 Tax=Shewanella sp. AS16 TaxID=2907625 RepID=UPI001F16E0E1|nr:MOSC domain-containing protein [Shewanella sp. AS16]MCE9687885.1 MOSC domain-containing protein [Shewanella sp. AS16]